LRVSQPEIVASKDLNHLHSEATLIGCEVPIQGTGWWLTITPGVAWGYGEAAPFGAEKRTPLANELVLPTSQARRQTMVFPGTERQD